MSEPTSLEQALTDLPAKPRVHELAKRAGQTSKEVIAALSAAGVTVASASSSVPAADAIALLTALLGPAAEPAVIDLPAEAVAEPDPGFFAAPLFLPPAAAEAKPARRRRAAKPAAKPAAEPAEPTAEPTLGEPGVPAVDPVEVSAQAQATAETLVETPAADGDDETPTGTSRSGRRRRGRGRGRGADSTDDNLETTESTPAEVGETRTTTDIAEPTEETDATGSSDESAADEDEDSEQGRRRRRRGRRGRGRVAGDGTDEVETDADELKATEAGEPAESAPVETDEDAPEGETSEEAATRRRRRRRRRGGSAEAGGEDNGREDDPDNTVVHVREPRAEKPSSSSASEVQGVRGSTRLEAKRQRRRDSRDGRKRPQILTEAEFLARREAVERVMAVRQRGDLAQVALLEDGVLVEHFVSRAGSESLMGNIYLGKVQNVLPSMEAAFVDIGKGRNAVLYAGEVNWDAAGLAGKARRIEMALSGGDTLLVQVSKDPVGQKGARLTTQISLPGRFLVYVPGGGATGISRKLPDTERKRLKSILDRIVPEDAGVIIRTAAEGVAEEELARDVDRLKTQWEEISRQAEKKSNAPQLLSAEPDTLIKVVRDLFNSDITRLVLDGDRAYEPVAAYIGAVAPELADRVSRYDGPNDVFTAYRIDEQIAKALERKVYLPSGGSLVIDRTEAMTVVDVNTGKYTGSGGNLEETVTKNNLEAAEEVVRQLRLRDIGGIIVVDFIDMVLESNRELVMRRLTECLGRDRTRHQVAEVTSLGLIQMTRKKMGTGLVEAFSEPCPHCHGRGIILHDVPMEDRSGHQHVEETDAGRSGRNRRNRSGRPEVAATPVEPIVKIVPAAPRPPDPRGPKPPTRGADDHQSEGHDSDEPQVDQPAIADEPPTRSERGRGRGSDAALNAPLSRDASAAVSAVLAALDAQAERQAAEVVAPTAAPVDTAENAAPAEAASGRRRGRRAAGRPAGAPSPVADVAAAPVPEVTVIDPVITLDPMIEPAVTAETVPAVEPEPTGKAPASEEVAPAAPEVTEPVEAPLKATRAPRRRGGRAAGAPTPVDPPVAVEPVVEPAQAEPALAETVVVEPVVEPAPAEPIGPAAEAATVKAPPRRRRAASRPAGPAAPPASSN